MAALGSNVGVARLVVIFRTIAVACVRLTKIHQADNVDARACGLIGSQNGVPRGNLEAQITNALVAELGNERSDHCIVIDKAAAPWSASSSDVVPNAFPATRLFVNA